MKRIALLFSIYLLTILTAKSQRTDTTSSNSSKDFYSIYNKKHFVYKTTGWVLLGSGLALAATSFLTYANNGYNGVWEQEGLFNLGGVMTVASIPFFILGGKNKRKAKLALKEETTSLGKKNLKLSYPAISLRLNL